MIRRFTDPAELCAALGVPFSDQQLTAITAPLEPGVIIAGAGSGKTTVMAARVVWLVGTGQVEPEQVLGLTFTRKAAAELSGRIRTALEAAGVVDVRGVDEAGEQVVLTYDAFAARLVSEHGLRIGVENDPVMITGASRYRLATRVVTAAAGPFENITRVLPRTVTERVLKLDAELTAHLVTREQLGAHTREFLRAVDEAPLSRARKPYASLQTARAIAEERLELAGLVADYAALKRSLGYVEFADQMAVAARLSREVPAVSRLLRERFRVVLLDEYQDTSSAQAALLRSLFSGDDVADGRGHPVTAVGDPHQAIYGWRGAAASNILQFADDFPLADGRAARRFALTVNRRSGPRILAVANDLAAGLHTDPAMAAAGEHLGLVAPEGTAPGRVEALAFESWPQEVGFIGERITALHAAGQVPAWSAIAVLTRRNAQIPALYADLLARDVPVEIVGLGGLLELPEIVDVTAVLELLDDVSANPALIRLLTGPRWAIGTADLALLGRRAAMLTETARPDASDLAGNLGRAMARTEATATPSLLEALEDPGDLPYSEAARQRFGLAAAELRALRRHAGEPVGDLVRRVVVSLGLEGELAAEGGTAAQLGAFADAVASYCDVDGEASLGGLLAYLAAEREHGVGLDQAVVSEADSVKLLTVHKAKGLEWDAVFVPGLALDVFPNLRVTDNWLKSAAVVPADLRGDAAAIPQLDDVTDPATKEYAEALKREARHAEDRLAYVAATRARRLLVASSHTWQAELVRPRRSSPYFDTIAAQADEVVLPPSLAAENPLQGTAGALDWPAIGDPEARRRRQLLARAVARARTAVEPLPFGLAPGEADQVAAWDDALERLLAAERSAGVGWAAPDYLSATGLVRLTREPEAFLAAARRPMPAPEAPAQRLGSRFHRWLEDRFGLAPALDVEPDEEPDDPRFAELSAAFERGRFATRRPLGVEVPFTMVLAGKVVRGRIDAVFATEGGYLVVDWKTGSLHRADPLQLAVYRVAWAELIGVPTSAVQAAFYDIARDDLRLHEELPERAELGASVSLMQGAGQRPALHTPG